MNVLQIIGGILLIVSSIIIVILVIMQDSKQSGLGALGGNQPDSYLSKNRGKTLESKIVLTTKIFAVFFFVLALAMNLIIRFVK